jgi:hypothetical protein
VQPLLLKQFALCLWRGVVVRYRNKDQVTHKEDVIALACASERT